MSIKRAIVVVAIVLIVGLPFVLRPKKNTLLKADDTLVLITPHNEALRYEFGRGFAEWYKEKTGRTISIDWRVIGGTSEIAVFLRSEYTAAFQYYWTQTLGKPWSTEVQDGFLNAKLSKGAPEIVKEARATWLASDVDCGMDVFFGGGTYDFDRQAQMGCIVDSGIMKKHPEWFRDDVIPQYVSGEDYWDSQGRWVGSVVSMYGIMMNYDALNRLHVPPPTQWDDLDNPALYGEIALADPTKSGSIAKAFENVIQQQMQRRLTALTAEHPNADPKKLEAQAVREGWLLGMRLMQRIGANARYFTDSSQKPPIDVAQGNSAVGMGLDFYGRQQQEAVLRRAQSKRVGFITPKGGTVGSVDPVALLRGAKHREEALLFIEYVLSMDGQKLWNFRPGTPGGPEHYALRRLPVRKDFYSGEYEQWRSDPGEGPFSMDAGSLVYRPAWTGGLFREMSFVIRVMCMDTHSELASAWRAIVDAGMPADALAAMQDLSAVDYDEVSTVIKQALGSRNKVEEIELATKLGSFFRGNYAKAEALAKAKARAAR